MAQKYTPDRYPELEVEFSDFDPGQEQTRHQPKIHATIDMGEFYINGKKIDSKLYEVIMEGVGEEVRDEILKKIEDGEIMA